MLRQALLAVAPLGSGVGMVRAQGVKEVSATSRDRKFLARSKGATIEVLDFPTRRVVSSIRAHRGNVTSLNISPDSKRLASADSTGKVCVLDLPTGRVLWQYTGARGVQIVTFSNDGTTLSATLIGGTNYRFDANTGRRLPVLKK